MSRTLKRQVARAAARKEAALEHYALERYGNNVTLADLHPDMKSLCAVVFELDRAYEFGDQKAVAEGFVAIRVLLGKYKDQENSVAKTDAID